LISSFNNSSGFLKKNQNQRTTDSKFLKYFQNKLSFKINSSNIISIGPGLQLISTYHQILALPWIFHLPRQIKPYKQILMRVWWLKCVLSLDLIKLGWLNIVFPKFKPMVHEWLTRLSKENVVPFCIGT
jgi:hypothetical protein